MIFDEAKLKKELSAAHNRNVYLLFGQESYITKAYTARLIKKYLSDDDKEFNLMRLNQLSTDTLSEAIDTLPVFAPFKVILLSDIEFDKLDNETLKAFLGIVEGVPETAVLIISNVTVNFDSTKAKPKKIIAAVEKKGVVAKFDYLTPAKISDFIIKRAAKKEVTISKTDALYIAELTLRDLTLIVSETDKLCSYAGKGGAINKADIDSLVVKQLDAGVYELATAITNKNITLSFDKLNELNQQGHPPVMILSALATTFVDYYRIKLGLQSSKSSADIAKDFAYPPNRSWVIGKSMAAAGKLKLKNLRNALKVLKNADVKLKSTALSDEVILQKALIEVSKQLTDS